MIVQIIKAVDSPNLRFLFDTGNTFTVCEDPVDAAYDAAPYTALVHLKDLRVLPWCPGREFVSAMYAAPLGRGHVNNRKILEICWGQQHVARAYRSQMRLANSSGERPGSPSP